MFFAGHCPGFFIPTGKTLADIDPETARFYEDMGNTKMTGELHGAIGDMYTQYLDIPESIVSRGDFKPLETAYRNYEANATVANAAAFLDEAGRVQAKAVSSGYSIESPYSRVDAAIEADFAARQGAAADMGTAATDISANATDLGATATDIGASAADIGANAKGYVDSAGGAGDNGSALELSTRFLNRMDPLWENAGKIEPIEGYQDVVCHGDTVSLVYRDGNGNEVNVSAYEFAEILKNSPVYEGGSIRLIACEAGADGSAVAQMVANRLGVDVLAPTDTVYVYPDGVMNVGKYNNGRWVIFSPKEW